MCRTGLFFFCLLLLSSCNKEGEDAMVSFRLQTDGLTFRQAFPDSSDEFESFSHKLAACEVFFRGEDGNFLFKVENDSLEHHVFELAAGTYELELRMAPASLYGQDWASYRTLSGEVEISAQTGLVEISIEPDCALFLVRDEFEQLEHGVFMIERHEYANGFFKSYPLSVDPLTGLYYTYFTPDTLTDSPSAFLWFFEGEPGDENGGLSTADMDIGIRYDIEILY